MGNTLLIPCRSAVLRRGWLDHAIAAMRPLLLGVKTERSDYKGLFPSPFSL